MDEVVGEGAGRFDLDGLEESVAEGRSDEASQTKLAEVTSTAEGRVGSMRKVESRVSQVKTETSRSIALCASVIAVERRMRQSMAVGKKRGTHWRDCWAVVQIDRQSYTLLLDWRNRTYEHHKRHPKEIEETEGRPDDGRVDSMAR